MKKTGIQDGTSPFHELGGDGSTVEQFIGQTTGVALSTDRAVAGH